MNTKTLLGVTAVVELAAGVALLAAPSRVAELLLGAGLDSPAANLVGRIAGTALFSIGLTCALVRDRPGSGKHTGRVVGLLAYNVGVAVLLFVAAVAERLHGIALWPAVALHAALSIWCAAVLIRS